MVAVVEKYFLASDDEMTLIQAYILKKIAVIGVTGELC